MPIKISLDCDLPLLSERIDGRTVIANRAVPQLLGQLYGEVQRLMSQQMFWEACDALDRFQEQVLKCYPYERVRPLNKSQRSRRYTLCQDGPWLVLLSHES